jgi:hypothetical protein
MDMGSLLAAPDGIIKRGDSGCSSYVRAENKVKAPHPGGQED